MISETHASELEEGLARNLIKRLRAEIDRRIDNPVNRESTWRFFLAMAGTWATEEGLAKPGAYDAIRLIVDKALTMLPRRGVQTFPAAAAPNKSKNG